MRCRAGTTGSAPLRSRCAENRLPVDTSSSDSWYQYLALPVAPLVLVAQGLVLVVHDRRIRLWFSAAATAALFTMFVYVTFLIDLPSDAGANIGAGLLFFALLFSLALFGAAAVRREARTDSQRAGAHRVAERFPRQPEERDETSPDDVDRSRGRSWKSPSGTGWAKLAVGSALALLLLQLSIFLFVPVIATGLSWANEGPSKVRWVATASTTLAAVYLFALRDL